MAFLPHSDNGLSELAAINAQNNAAESKVAAAVFFLFSIVLLPQLPSFHAKRRSYLL
ncbi:hypothetical protein SD78_2830 [Bacillus badius]|nr:hypothetical protein SD78_2830 [Bacillus badius]